MNSKNTPNNSPKTKREMGKQALKTASILGVSTMMLINAGCKDSEPAEFPTQKGAGAPNLSKAPLSQASEGDQAILQDKYGNMAEFLASKGLFFVDPAGEIARKAIDTRKIAGTLGLDNDDNPDERNAVGPLSENDKLTVGPGSSIDRYTPITLKDGTVLNHWFYGDGGGVIAIQDIIDQYNEDRDEEDQITFENIDFIDFTVTDPDGDITHVRLDSDMQITFEPGDAETPDQVCLDGSCAPINTEAETQTVEIMPGVFLKLGAPDLDGDGEPDFDPDGDGKINEAIRDGVKVYPVDTADIVNGGLATVNFDVSIFSKTKLDFVEMNIEWKNADGSSTGRETDPTVIKNHAYHSVEVPVDSTGPVHGTIHFFNSQDGQYLDSEDFSFNSGGDIDGNGIDDRKQGLNAGVSDEQISLYRNFTCTLNLPEEYVGQTIKFTLSNGERTETLELPYSEGGNYDLFFPATGIVSITAQSFDESGNALSPQLEIGEKEIQVDEDCDHVGDKEDYITIKRLTTDLPTSDKNPNLKIATEGEKFHINLPLNNPENLPSAKYAVVTVYRNKSVTKDRYVYNGDKVDQILFKKLHNGNNQLPVTIGSGSGFFYVTIDLYSKDDTILDTAKTEIFFAQNPEAEIVISEEAENIYSRFLEKGIDFDKTIVERNKDYITNEFIDAVFLLHEQGVEITNYCINSGLRGINRIIASVKDADFMNIVKSLQNAGGNVNDQMVIQMYYNNSEAQVNALIELQNAGVDVSTAMLYLLDTDDLSNPAVQSALATLSSEGVVVPYYIVERVSLEALQNVSYMRNIVKLHENNIQILDLIEYYTNPDFKELAMNDAIVDALVELESLGVYFNNEMFFRVYRVDITTMNTAIENLKILIANNIRAYLFFDPRSDIFVDPVARDNFIFWVHAGGEPNPENFYANGSNEFKSSVYTKNLLKLMENGIDNVLTDLNLKKGENEVYVNNLIKLHKNGIQDDFDDIVRQLTLEKGASEAYVNGLIKLQQNGININESFISFLDLEKGESEACVNNLIKLQQNGMDLNNLRLMIYLFKGDVENSDYTDALVRLLQNGITIDHMIMEFLTLEKVLSPEYVDALIELQENGAKIDRPLVYYLSLEKVLNPEYMNTLTGLQENGIQIDDDLIKHLSLEKSLNSDYISTLIELQENGIQVSGYIIKNLTLSEGTNEAYINTLFQLQENGVNVDSIFIASLPENKALSETYVNALIALHQNGVKVNGSFVRCLTLEEAVSTDHINALIRLQQNGIKVYDELLFGLTLEKSGNADYVDALIYLHKNGVVINLDLLDSLSIVEAQDQDYLDQIIANGGIKMATKIKYATKRIIGKMLA